MATAVPVARTTAKTTSVTASAAAAPKPAAVKGTPGRPKGAVVTGPVLSWTAERRNALIDAYRAGNTSAGELVTALVAHPAFKGIENRVTSTKVRNQWAGLAKKMARKGYSMPDLERSGNGELDLDGLWARLQGGEGAVGAAEREGTDVDDDGTLEGEDEGDGEFEE